MAGLRYIFVLLALACLWAAPAGAQTLQDTTCMPEMMTIIEANGLIEAEREIIQNQNLIAKPDSVLEYSCFEQHLTLSGLRTGEMFTEAESFFGINDAFIDEYSLDRGIYFVVFQALVEYMRENFWHRYLGDRADLQALPTGGTGDFTCYAMGYVWNRAKCSNFIEPRNTRDGFYTFDEYRDMTDPRNLPEPLQCDNWPDWADEITDSRRASAPSSTPDPGTALNDDLVVYPLLFEPDDCSQSEPVPTGLYVPPFTGAGQDGYQEYVCLAPGCYYNGSTCAR